MPGVLGVFTGERPGGGGPRRRSRRSPCSAGPRRQADVRRRHAGARGRSHPLCRRAGRDRRGARRWRRRRTPPKQVRSISRAAERPMSSARWRGALRSAEAPGNIALDWADGDAAAVDAAFAHAAHMVDACGSTTRALAPVSMEPRAGIGTWDEASERYTLIASTQGVAVVRKLLAEGVFKVPAGDDPRADPRCRRRLRHEGADLSGIRRDPLRGAPMRPAGEVVQQPDRELPLRHARARRHPRRRARARRGRQVPRPAHAQLSSASAPTRRQYAAIFSTINTKNCLSSVYRIPGDPHRREDGARPTRRRSGPIAAPGGRRRST